MTPNYCTSVLKETFFFILLSRVDIVDNRDKWKVPRHLRRRCLDWYVICFRQKCLLFTGGASHARGTFFCLVLKVFMSWSVIYISCPRYSGFSRYSRYYRILDLKELQVVLCFLSLSEFSWVYLIWPVFLSFLSLSEFIWVYLSLSDFFWVYLSLSEFIWIYLS